MKFSPVLPALFSRVVPLLFGAIIPVCVVLCFSSLLRRVLSMGKTHGETNRDPISICLFVCF